MVPPAVPPLPPTDFAAWPAWEPDPPSLVTRENKQKVKNRKTPAVFLSGQRYPAGWQGKGAVAAALVSKSNPPPHASPKPHSPPKQHQCRSALGRTRCPAEDLPTKHARTEQKQNQPPPQPQSDTENRTPALGAFALFLAAGPTPRAELIRAAGRSCRPASCCEQLEADFLFWTWQARAKLRASGCRAPLLAGQLQGDPGFPLTRYLHCHATKMGQMQ